MLRHVYQSGILTIFNSAGSHPLELWRTSTGANGRVDLVQDRQLGETVLCLESADLAHTFITCPQQTTNTLGIKLPYLVLMVQNTDHLFSMEAEVADDHGTVRRLRAGNYEAEVHVEQDIGRLPLQLDPGWNYLALDLGQLTTRVFGTAFKEARRVTVHASTQVRLIYFADRIVPEEELPSELRLYASSDTAEAEC
ncbi:hypothetical protein GGF46_003053 [Coemansia sp. RSA 552]|nr:hypothetical protein GGF46_003053 [Coemansia sp. RSA 552]